MQPKQSIQILKKDNNALKYFKLYKFEKYILDK